MHQLLHVSISGSDDADGSPGAPLRTIGRAAELVRPGGTVRVHAGVYREWVRPQHGGLSETRRVTFEAAPGEHVVITGSEPVADWQRVEGDVWRTEVPNALFGDWNPFAEPVRGDWLVRPFDEPRHVGDVYVRGVSGYEVDSAEAVAIPVERAEVLDDWTGLTVPVPRPESAPYQWHAAVGAETTVITALMPGVDPTAELVEISVRRSVFFPTEHHVDFVTVRGFELCHAATPWAPPTADQPGLIGPNWAKGWIIEDNHIHDAKCSAISLGKERTTGHNYSTERGDKPGYQYQLESVFSALQIGWDKEHIGSHVVRRNTIHDCGQNGIVGHLGCAFSVIEDNHIFRIGTKREFFGHEIAGIKLHAAIDTRIEHNRLHDCNLGLWLDWQTQGTRITRNVFHGNSRDLFVEVSHGPYVVDHNLLASPAAIEDRAQGGAYVHNLIGGTVQVEPVVDRATPYHVPHSTQVAGFAVTAAGDDRFIGNLFLGDPERPSFDPEGYFGLVPPQYGLAVFDAHPESFAAYLASVPHDPAKDHQRFIAPPQPVYIARNVYAAGNEPYVRESDPVRLEGPVPLALREDGEELHLEITVPAALARATLGPITGTDLEHVRFAGVDFEEDDGSPVRIERDLLGALRDEDSVTGPFAGLREGENSIRLW
ncbi:right-handed parallel beta-helix repeat-containing protein [Brachybacterium sp. UNK5269]|uniref:right-handed parallel beta-helix repeat-containing protein n=1 Tax=Brachybacterium sp. UNK5269 TaxID=3408576 RepID=UPI003BB0EB99